MAESDRTIRQLKAEIDTDLSTFVKQYVGMLRSTTPIDTGRARNGWQQTFRKGQVGNKNRVPIARNDVPYIGVLDEGWSKQAPRGIVEPALNRTRKK